MAKVSKIMLINVPTLKKEAKIGDAAKLLAANDTGCVIIIDNDLPVGIVTELDFVRKVISKGLDFKKPLADVMTFPIVSMTPNMKLDEALKMIDTKGFRRYPVVENGKLAGLATKKDIVNAISDNLRFHRYIQNIVLILFVLFEFFVFVLYRYIYQFISSGG